MRHLVLHIGMPKTGTTSIQASLSAGIADPRFRLLSMDTAFGNQMVGALFHNAFQQHPSYFRAVLSDRQLKQFRRRAYRYLDRSLLQAARDGVTPIISAEIAWAFEEADCVSLKRFMSDRGFETSVICYMRAPLDFFESSFHQLVIAGVGRSWADLFEKHRFADSIHTADRVFGRDNVTPLFFEPAAFPQQCVVHHFCQQIGLSPTAVNIVRVNEGLSLDALKLLYTADRANAFRYESFLSRLRRRLLIARLRDLPGPRMRFCPSITGTFRKSIEQEWPWLEDRLGRSIPISLLPREPAAEIRSEADMFDVSGNARAWLAEQAGARMIRSSGGVEPAEQVLDHLRRLAMVNCRREIAKAISEGVRLRLRQPWT